MRNIIFTSLLAAIAAGPAWTAADITKGCFMRDYSDAHLAKHPRQVVDWIRVKIHQDSYGETVADLDILVANQGHARADGHGGKILDQVLFCWQDGAEKGCSVECDGGIFYVTRDDGKTLTFRTKNLWVGDVGGCGGAIDLAEVPNEFVSYRLNRVDDAVCEGN